MSMIHEITAAVPRYKRGKRKGRGESSGKGKTSGRGNKGSKARVGTYIKRGYEGGQTPIFRRVPKRGFSNANFANNFHVVNVEALNRFDEGATVDAQALRDAGLIPDMECPVKILGNGELQRKLTVVAGWYSKSAQQKITSAGGAAQNLEGQTFEFPKPKKPPVKFSKQPGKKAAKTEEAPVAEAPAKE